MGTLEVPEMIEKQMLLPWGVREKSNIKGENDVKTMRYRGGKKREGCLDSVTFELGIGKIRIWP